MAGDVVQLAEAGRAGMFIFDPADLSARVAADRMEGIYIAPVAVPTGSHGAWVRQYEDGAVPEWFGAGGAGSTDDGRAWLAAAATGYLKAKPGSIYAMALRTITVPCVIDMRGATLKLLPGNYVSTTENAILFIASSAAVTRYSGGIIDGNKANVTGMRQSGIHIGAGGHVIVEDVRGFDVTQHVIRCRGENCIIQNIYGANGGRDVVSLEKAKNTFVQNVYGVGSADRGTVEICDGTTGCTVRNVWGKDQTYVVDFQDHLKASHANVSNLVETVRGENVTHLLRNTTVPEVAHRDLTVRDIQGDAGSVDGTAVPIQFTNISGVTISDVSLRGANCQAIVIEHCDKVQLTRTRIRSTSRHLGSDIVVQDCDEVIVDALQMHDNVDGGGLIVQVTDAKTAPMKNIRISNVVSGNLGATGVRIRETGAQTMDYVSVTGCICRQGIAVAVSGSNVVNAGNLT